MIIERRLGCPLVMHNGSLKKPSSRYSCRKMLTRENTNYRVDRIRVVIPATAAFRTSPLSFPGCENSKSNKSARHCNVQEALSQVTSLSLFSLLHEATTHPVIRSSGTKPAVNATVAYV
jgi:hypothetical protein